MALRRRAERSVGEAAVPCALGLARSSEQRNDAENHNICNSGAEWDEEQMQWSAQSSCWRVSGCSNVYFITLGPK